MKPAYIRFFPSDFLAGAALLAPEERGVYAYLLILQADRGVIDTPVDDLARHLEVSSKTVERVLQQKFAKFEDGWRNVRMHAEREHSIAVRDAKSKGGKTGATARKRASKRLPQESSKTVASNLEDSSHNQNQNQRKEERERKSAGAGGHEIPTLTESRQWAKAERIAKATVDGWHANREAQGWVRGNGIPIANWRADLRAWAHEDARRAQAPRPTGGRSERPSPPPSKPLKLD